MDYKIRIVRYLYYFSLTGLLILYLFPGSLIGYFLYGDFQPATRFYSKPYGNINQSRISFFLFINTWSNELYERLVLTKLQFFLIVLSLLLELSHLIIPNRSFQSLDLFANLLGTLLAIVIIFFYKRLKNGKI